MRLFYSTFIFNQALNLNFTLAFNRIERIVVALRIHLGLQLNISSSFRKKLIEKYPHLTERELNKLLEIAYEIVMKL